MLLEDKIRELCEQAIRASDEDAVRISRELRQALHKHLGEVRDKLIATASFSPRKAHVSSKKAA